MAIDYSKLRGLTVRELAHALERDGFSLKRSKGATRLFCHPDGRRVILHEHRPGQLLKIGTLKEIIENEARWDESDLKRLGLLR
jgi:predicted RNA binding protein YcfA (HicA-like mRNA interferase family)